VRRHRGPPSVLACNCMPLRKQIPSPPSTPPALSPSGHTQIDHATVPAHTHLSCVPPVCDASLSLLSEGG